MIGTAPADMTGRRFTDFIHPDDVGQFAQLLSQWRRAPGPRTLQHRMLTASGESFGVETVVSPLFDETRRLTGAVSSSRDIRERRRAESELRLAHERTEVASRAKSRFLANMSHELRTPLNAIIGFSEILSREMFGPIGTPRYKEYSDLILESGRLLLDLINDLLDMAKIEAGRYVVSPDVLDLHELLAATLRLVQRQIESKGLEVAIDVPELTSPLVADQRAIKQIVLNLLSNAIKFTPARRQHSARRQPGCEVHHDLGQRHRHRHSGGSPRPPCPALRAGAWRSSYRAGRHGPRPRARALADASPRRRHRDQEPRRRRHDSLRASAA